MARSRARRGISSGLSAAAGLLVHTFSSATFVGDSPVSIAELSTSAFGSVSEGPPSEERVPPQDLHAEQSVLGGMLLSKDAIADCVEGLRGTDFYRPAHELDLRRGPRPLRPRRARRRDHRLRRARQARRPAAASAGRPTSTSSSSRCRPPPTPATTPQIVAERAVLRRLVEAGTRIVQLGYAAGRRRRRGHRQRAPRPRSTPSPTSAAARTTTCSATSSRRPLNEIEVGLRPHRRDDRRAHRVHRARRADQRPAPGPDDRHRRASRRRQVDPRPRHRPRCRDQAQAWPRPSSRSR